jgi:hypothetical protein
VQGVKQFSFVNSPALYPEFTVFRNSYPPKRKKSAFILPVQKYSFPTLLMLTVFMSALTLTTGAQKGTAAAGQTHLIFD